MREEDPDKPPFRPPHWVEPYGVWVSLAFASVGFACVSPLGPVLAQQLGSASVHLTGWFLILGAALMAFNANAAERGGLFDAAGRSLFGALPLVGFVVVCGALAYVGWNAEPVNWHGAAFAVPAVLATVLLTRIEEPEESEHEFHERMRLERGNPDPLSVERDERLEPVVPRGADRSVFIDFVAMFVSWAAQWVLIFTYLFAFGAAYFGLYAEVVRGESLTLDSVAARMPEAAQRYIDLFGPYFALLAIVGISAVAFDVFERWRRLRRRAD